MRKKQAPEFPLEPYMFDPEESLQRNQDDAEVFYLSQLESECSVGVTPDGVDLAFIRQFFNERKAEFDAGIVSRFDYPIWKTIGFLLSYPMTFEYECFEQPTDREFDFNRDAWYGSEYIYEIKDQRAVTSELKQYLIAAGALAHRIGSSTYDGWRQLLVQVEFKAVAPNAEVFDSQSFTFKVFKAKLDELISLLWADNVIFAHQLDVHPPHPQQPKSEGCVCGTKKIIKKSKRK